MNHYAILPKSFEAILIFPRGSFWLFSNREYTGKHKSEIEYKAYSNIGDVCADIAGLDGVSESAHYATSKGHWVGSDFIVQSHASKGVLRILGWDGNSNPPLQNELF